MGKNNPNTPVIKFDMNNITSFLNVTALPYDAVLNFVQSNAPAAAIGLGASLSASTFLVHAIGFTPAGVAANSLAALWHSSIGNVASGSVFAALQSFGVLGSTTTTV